jgi:hypothetical protein
MNLSHLGAPVGAMTRVDGGLLNRMWRLETDQGVFAVKELTRDRGWTYRPDDIFRLEQAAFAGGIPMPEPISADTEVLVHRWVEGSKVPEKPVRASFAFEIGAILARLHALDIEWTHVSIEDPMPTDWPELATAAVASHQPWADELLDAVDSFSCDRRVRRRVRAPWSCRGDAQRHQPTEPPQRGRSSGRPRLGGRRPAASRL